MYGRETRSEEGAHHRDLRFTRGEYWLLESVAEYRVPLACLVDPRLDEALNKPPHGLSRAELLDTLERLVARGFVRATNEQEELVTRDELSAALAEGQWDRKSDYGLTRAGGAAWEAFAAPNWSRRLDSSNDGDARYEVICADRGWLEAYLTALRREGTLDESTLVYDQVVPWSATYWRELPRGHRARFVFVRDSARWPPVAASWYCNWHRWR